MKYSKNYRYTGAVYTNGGPSDTASKGVNRTSMSIEMISGSWTEEEPAPDDSAENTAALQSSTSTTRTYLWERSRDC